MVTEPEARGFHVVELSGPEFESEPVHVQAVHSDEPPRVYSLSGEVWKHTPRPAPTRAPRKCGTRARAPRGRPVRVRGSRRSTAAAHSSSSDDPGLGGEPPRYRPSLPQGAMA